MLASFVIPQKGRVDLLSKTISSIQSSHGDLADSEIIVVSQDGSLELDSALNARTPGVNVIQISREKTISALRNAGADQASGDYIAFLDADVEIEPNWLSTMIAELASDGKRAMVSARQKSAVDAPVVEIVRVALANMNTRGEVQFLPGSNLLLRRETFIDSGGFPEHLATAEDYYFSSKVARVGSLYCSSKSSYVHLGEDKSFTQLFRKEVWRGKSNIQSIHNRRIELSELPSLLTPVWLLACVLALVLALALTNAVGVAASLTLFTLPIFLYAVRLCRLSASDIKFHQAFGFYAAYLAGRMFGMSIEVYQIVKNKFIDVFRR